MTPSLFHFLRRTAGSQRAVATRMGIGFRTLQRIEAGTLGDPVPVKYQRLIRAIGDEK